MPRVLQWVVAICCISEPQIAVQLFRKYISHTTNRHAFINDVYQERREEDIGRYSAAWAYNFNDVMNKAINVLQSISHVHHI